MRTAIFLLALIPNLMALEITTLDGKTYRDCRVGQTYPDSICVLNADGGARIKFANLPESVRVQFGYDPQRAAAFERAEVARTQRERALALAYRQRSKPQQHAMAATATPSPPGNQTPGYGANPGAEYVGVSQAPANTGRYNQSGNAYGAAGAQYVGVRLAGPGGGIYGLAYGATRPRP